MTSVCLFAALEAAKAESAAARQALAATQAERDSRAQMLQGIKVMLAQSEALRKFQQSQPEAKVKPNFLRMLLNASINDNVLSSLCKTWF